MATTQTIVEYTSYGTPSGNYDGSSTDFASNGVRAADYYRGYGGLQTVTYQLTDFIGTIFFEATLDPTAEDANWFPALEVNDGSTATTETRSQSIVGNFTWMRVRIQGFDGGIINYINITY